MSLHKFKLGDFLENEKYWLGFDYEDVVCSLLQAVEDLMSGYEQEQMRPYLYYVKYLLDQYIKFVISRPSIPKIEPEAVLGNLIEIFMSKSGIKSFPYSVPQHGGGAFPNCFAHFTEVVTPFHIFDEFLSKLEINSKQSHIILNTIDFSLTSRRFFNTCAAQLILGCLSCFNELYGWQIKLHFQQNQNQEWLLRSKLSFIQLVTESVIQQQNQA